MLVPGGREHAGGIGRWAGYLHDSWTAQSLHPSLDLIDTRSTGHLGHAVFAAALTRITWLHATGRLASVHANLSKRGSTARKWIVSHLTAAIGIPLILHLHGSGYDAFYAALPPFWQRRVAALFHRADHIIVLGTAWADWVSTTLAIPPDRITILHNGVPLPTPQSRTPGPCRILFLGRLGPRKGTPELLTALSTLRDHPWTATLAGDGDLAPYRTEIASAGLSDRIALPGWLPAPAAAALLVQADILVLPSHAENFPIAIIEALAAAVAIVATPVGATPELLTHDQSALFVPVGDPQALGQALQTLIDDPARRHRIATAGHAIYRAHLDIDALAPKLAAIHRAAIRDPIPC